MFDGFTVYKACRSWILKLLEDFAPSNPAQTGPARPGPRLGRLTEQAAHYERPERPAGADDHGGWRQDWDRSKAGGPPLVGALSPQELGLCIWLEVLSYCFLLGRL